jgi:hypothetical protein
VLPGFADRDLHVEIVRVALCNFLEAKINAFERADIGGAVNLRIHSLELIQRIHEKSQFPETSKSIPFIARWW